MVSGGDEVRLDGVASDHYSRIVFVVFVLLIMLGSLISANKVSLPYHPHHY